MTIVIWIFIAIALMQFVWYSIIAPAARMRLRYDLFCQRDKLRGLRMELGQTLDQDVYAAMEDSINAAIRLLPDFEISMLISFDREMARNPSLRERLERRGAMIEDCSIKEIHEIRKTVGNLLSLALVANCAGWVVWLAPLFLAMICANKISGSVKQLLSIRQCEAEKIGLAPEIA